MTVPVESFVGAGAKRFRILTWGAGSESVLFLHGLTGVAEVWGPVIDFLPPGRRYIAMDARGHGQSSAPIDGYSASAMVEDAVRVIESLGPPVHLVGHSMGARTALVLAARRPRLLRSVAVVDIGPEASKANIATTIRGIEGRPVRFASEAEGTAFAFRNRTPSESDIHIFLARLDRHPDASLTWRASREALVQCVKLQRSRDYWDEWRRISVPALFVHGGASNEVSTGISDRMRAENPGILFERFDGIGHNIPLLAPQRLAESLMRHWTSASNSAT